MADSLAFQRLAAALEAANSHAQAEQSSRPAWTSACSLAQRLPSRDLQEGLLAVCQGYTDALTLVQKQSRVFRSEIEAILESLRDTAARGLAVQQTRDQERAESSAKQKL